MVTIIMPKNVLVTSIIIMIIIIIIIIAVISANGR